MKIALVHDWLTGMRGGESVLEAIAEIFPRADLFTLIHVPGSISPTLTTLKKHTSILQKIPKIEKRYRNFLPFFPKLIERFDLTEYDLVLSSSHCVAKGVRKRADAVHVAYVHAPMRYVWDRYEDYFGKGRASPWVRFAAKTTRRRLQDWDRASSLPDRIDAILANSQFISDRIREAWGRDSTVVHPFVEWERFQKAHQPGKNYLILGAFAPYKRIDLAIEAFNRMRRPLILLGGGQVEAELKKIAGPTIEFIGALPNSAVEDVLSKTRALIFPGVEDFGITPLEAMAAGTPVIAYGRGGALETVTSRTGLFYESQTIEGLIQAVQDFEKNESRFSEADCRARAKEFSKIHFQRKYIQEILNAWSKKGKPRDSLQNEIKKGWVKNIFDEN